MYVNSIAPRIICFNWLFCKNLWDRRKLFNSWFFIDSHDAFTNYLYSI